MNLDAFIFVPALVGSVVTGFIFCLFAAHTYLTVLQSTGAGAKLVTWVSEPILDHFWKMFYLAWLIGIWLGPAYFIGRAMTAGSDSTWLRLAIPLAVFWVAYPVSQLSSLSGPTIWLPLHPDVFARLAQKPAVVLGFLGLSAGALAWLGLGYHLTFFKSGRMWLPAGSVIFGTCALIYARLLGRLAFVLAFTKSFLKRKKRDPAESKKVSELTPDEPEVTQPSELPPLETALDGLITGYDLTTDEDPPKRVVAEVVKDADPEPAPKRPSRKTGGTHIDKSRQWTDEDEDATPYGVGEAEPIMEDEAAPSVVIKPTDAEMKLISRDDAPKRPKKAWTAEVWQFLRQPDTLAAIGLLSLLCSLVGGMIRICRAFNPVAGGE
jgi:hypothetical protein